MTSWSPIVCAIALTMLAVPARVAAQSEAPPATPPASAPLVVQEPDPDLQIVAAEPDFTLAALPTSLRMPTGKFAFRLSHRFNRPIASGDVGDFFADFFGFDSSARIGLELRYGLRPGTEATFLRTNDRAIQFLGQHEVVRQDDSRPYTLDALAAIAGANNFSEDFSLALGGIVSHRFDERGAIYAHPMVVINANPLPSDDVDHNHTVLIGIGGRWRIGQSRVYLVAEIAPRVGGFAPGAEHVSVAIEKRAGGHVFQFNVSNSLATTLRQVARGGPGEDNWFVGFNLSRRFY